MRTDLGKPGMDTCAGHRYCSANIAISNGHLK